MFNDVGSSRRRRHDDSPGDFAFRYPANRSNTRRQGRGERVQKNIAYSEAGGDRTRLDVYSPDHGKNQPVVIWIHGGAWQIGDKANVQLKPKAFSEQGFVFVSVNYRFHPKVTSKEQAGDIARAIRWVHDHIGDHGGDPGRVFLMGHSAGRISPRWSPQTVAT